MDFLQVAVAEKAKIRPPHRGGMPFDGYTLYYVGQAMYQAGGQYWKKSYPTLRDFLTESQYYDTNDPTKDGMWKSGGHVGGRPGDLYGTSVACFILAIPNRYLPILQEGKIESFKQRYRKVQ